MRAGEATAKHRGIRKGDPRTKVIKKDKKRSKRTKAGITGGRPSKKREPYQRPGGPTFSSSMPSLHS